MKTGNYLGTWVWALNSQGPCAVVGGARPLAARQFEPVVPATWWLCDFGWITSHSWASGSSRGGGRVKPEASWCPLISWLLNSARWDWLCISYLVKWLFPRTVAPSKFTVGGAIIFRRNRHWLVGGYQDHLDLSLSKIGKMKPTKMCTILSSR